jgi:hypothetical protein
MTIDELTKKEIEIVSKIQTIEGTIDEKYEKITKAGLFSEYKMIHQEYAKLCFDDIEALKRGLFIYWLSMSEPSFLTGIDELDEDSNVRIIIEIDKNIKNQTMDSELENMLNYYKNWDYIFSKYSKFNFLHSKMMSNDNFDSHNVDKNKMINRGQMGVYWSSLNDKPTSL